MKKSLVSFLSVVIVFTALNALTNCGPAKQVVKEVWKLTSGEKFSVMNYTFTSEKI